MRMLTDYDFVLPPQLIAQTPSLERDKSRLLRVQENSLDDLTFGHIVDLIPKDSVLVLNQSKVVPSRLFVKKETGGSVELVGVQSLGGDHKRWRCLARSSKAIRKGAKLLGPQALVVYVEEERAEDGTIVVCFPESGFDCFDRHGELPLPPYIERPDGPTSLDKERYQTVYAQDKGSVAAPTAGLHFTDSILETLAKRGVSIAFVTLHVGLGTFAPVRSERIDDHTMHAERFDIPKATVELISSGRPVVAVGTTSLRTLEAAATGDHQVSEGPSETSIFITPGYSFKVIDYLLTNFHLPKSTLMMLVSAFAGYQRIRNAYEHAVAKEYRFFSYGDAMFLKREGL